MLGSWLWTIIAGAVVATLAFVWVIVREGRIAWHRLIWFQLAGLVGGIAALASMKAVTNSRVADLGGPIDWLLAVAIFVAGLIGTTVGVYAVLGVLGIARVLAGTGAEAAAGVRPSQSGGYASR